MLYIECYYHIHHQNWEQSLCCRENDDKGNKLCENGCNQLILFYLTAHKSSSARRIMDLFFFRINRFHLESFFRIDLESMKNLFVSILN